MMGINQIDHQTKGDKCNPWIIRTFLRKEYVLYVYILVCFLLCTLNLSGSVIYLQNYLFISGTPPEGSTVCYWIFGADGAISNGGRISYILANFIPNISALKSERFTY